MEKVVRDGKVAVVYHPSWGAGWYTWHYNLELLFSPQIVAMIEGGAGEDEFQLYMAGFEDLGGEGLHSLEELAIAWVDQGVEFIVHEYDGAESVMLKNEYKWITA